MSRTRTSCIVKDKYLLRERIGEGGHGKVFLADDLSTGTSNSIQVGKWPSSTQCETWTQTSWRGICGGRS